MAEQYGAEAQSVPFDACERSDHQCATGSIAWFGGLPPRARTAYVRAPAGLKARDDERAARDRPAAGDSGEARAA